MHYSPESLLFSAPPKKVENPWIGESESAPTHSVILLRNPWLCVPLDILPYTSKERYNVRAYHHKDGAIQE
jgi:hypothetical protein